MADEEIVDAEIVEETPATKGPLKIAVIGDESNPLAMSTYRAFDVPRGVETHLFEVDRIDDAIEAKPNLVFWCEELGVKKNDTIDDGDFLTAVQKFVRSNGAGVCIRSTINMDVHDRLMMSLTREGVNAKVAYMPEVCGDVQLLGGSPETIQSQVRIMESASWFSTRNLMHGTIAEVVYANLAISGYRLVQQTFFDQLHGAVMDMKGANPMVVNRLTVDALGHGVTPSWTNNFQYDARVFSGSTDKLTLIESCLEK
jgi:hypothetical protein